ncbi:MAG: SpoIID/LytB domain-containing protein [Candidatus Brocadiales bacterium]|uniref:SpoIID/LytB domain-containing protein n=1 Tax=Candidatus Wunengus sp. YC60 TaxID=3367697 RepID=UPI0027133D38|nr:SpoIID/LytB domain-containing protein [Candidatus Brocadiales bacterium]
MFAILPAMSAGIPLSCQRGTTVVHDYGAILDKIPVLRVLLMNDVKEAQLSINGSYQITGSLTNIIDQGQGLQKTKISASNGGISIGNKRYDNSELRITGLRDGAIELNNIRYRGEIRIVQQFNNKFSVIEEVDLESFISGVLGSEMPQTWNEEALRAQAVTARTYAMYKKKVRRNEVYHLDMLELAYRGMSSESPRLNKIVQDTKGIVMVYDWNIFPAYFHSTCGGHTEDVGSVFGKDSMPPLSGVACNYCNNSKYSRWSTDVSKSEIERRLRDANIYVSNISTVKAIDPGAGKHGSRVEIVSADGSKEMNANDFRLVVGPNYLYSTAFDSRNNGQSITFTGRGWGHGVGLCQYGAQAMAEKGFQWAAILKYYYPKIELVRVY